MGFVGVGMESNFRELKAKLKGGKPIIMYIFGQTFDLFFYAFICLDKFWYYGSKSTPLNYF